MGNNNNNKTAENIVEGLGKNLDHRIRRFRIMPWTVKLKKYC